MFPLFLNEDEDRFTAPSPPRPLLPALLILSRLTAHGVELR